MSFDLIAAILILIWIFIYSSSYGVWTWNKKNRIGGAAVLLVSLAALVFPLYLIFFRT
ncbi:MAG TPA: hypothetical protein GXX49_04535 [Clostridiaceae bacterium]|jgi:hypothetical protein|nr:hypothetical protein [Clostridiaceae bacterium]